MEGEVQVVVVMMRESYEQAKLDCRFVHLERARANLLPLFSTHSMLKGTRSTFEP